MKFEEFDLSQLASRVIPPMPWHDYFRAWKELPFKPERPAAPQTAWWLAEASLLAYESPNFIRNVLLKSGMEGFRFFDLPSTQAFVAWKDAWAMVVFRGTELRTWRAILDIVTDASLARKPYLGGWVHGGFLDAFLSAWNEADPRDAPAPVAESAGGGRRGPASLWNRLAALFRHNRAKGRHRAKSRHWAQSLPQGVPWASSGGMADFIARLRKERRGLKVFYAGHSLGAALATLAAASDPDAAALHAFGSPMVGDESFARRLSCPAWRWVNGADLVTQLPPPASMERALGYRYVHVGTPLHLDSSGRFCDAPEESPSLRELLDRDIRSLVGKERKKGALSLADLSALGRVGSILELPSLADHAPLAYAYKVWNIMARGDKIP